MRRTAIARCIGSSWQKSYTAFGKWSCRRQFREEWNLQVPPRFCPKNFGLLDYVCRYPFVPVDIATRLHALLLFALGNVPRIPETQQYVKFPMFWSVANLLQWPTWRRSTSTVTLPANSTGLLLIKVEVLSITKGATKAEIKKAYHRVRMPRIYPAISKHEYKLVARSYWF